MNSPDSPFIFLPFFYLAEPLLRELGEEEQLVGLYFSATNELPETQVEQANMGMPSESDWLKNPELFMIRVLQNSVADPVAAIAAAYDRPEIERIVAELTELLNHTKG
jgi:hypothetical protein